MITVGNMSQFFVEKQWRARIISKRKKHIVLIKTDPENFADTVYFFEQHRPDGVTFIYKKLTLIDEFFMHGMKVLTELR